jgi:predicted metal-dependent hydrolase
MNEIIQLGEISIQVTRKAIKHVHLSVHPPLGRVTLAAPAETRLDVARAYAISKLGRIREQQSKLRSQARETPRAFVTRETHYLWGRRYLLAIRYEDVKPSVALDHRRITLTVRPGASAAAKAEVVHAWHKSLLHDVVPDLILKWEPKLGVKGERVLSAANENEVGRMQSPRGPHPPEHGACEKAEGPAGIRGRP